MNASDEPGGPPPAGLRANGIVGSYVLLERLGAGGVGEVWKARDRVLNRVVALKFIAAPRHGSSPLGDLLREARAASALNHPNVITIFEVGEREGGTYLAMEFVEGETLRRRADRGSVPLGEAIDIARQIVSGLASAHAHGIVHRDLKPENIMLRADGYVKLVDFGLAKILPWEQVNTGDPTARPEPVEGRASVAVSESGRLAGTFTYMSPEQARGLPVGAATDVFSLGIVLYELLTGEHPFRAETVLDTLNAIVGKDPINVLVKCPLAPPAFGEIVSKALRKNPAERYPSAVEIKEPLARMQVLPEIAAERATGSAVAKRRRRSGYAAGALPIAAMVVWSLWSFLRPPSRDPVGEPYRSVAIMTFNTDADDQQAAALAQGLPEDLGSALSAAGVRVASRSSVVEMGAAANTRAGTQLGVDAVVEGSVRSVGSKVRIHVELVSARTRFQIWSGTFTSGGAEILGGDQTTMTEIAGQLRAKMTPR